VAKYDVGSSSRAGVSSSSSSGNGGGGVGVIPVLPPTEDPYLCAETDGLVDYTAEIKDGSNKYSINTVMLVPRGQCSFEAKALSAQRLGSSSIIIYGSLSSRYGLNYTNSSTSANDAKTRTDYTNKDVIWPLNKYDYDCTYGRALLPTNEMDKLNFVALPGGYDADTNDASLVGRSGDGNLCVKYNVENNTTTSTSSSEEGAGGEKKNTFATTCASQRCLVTGHNVTNKNNKVYYEACCAWDLHVWLFGDAAIEKVSEKVTIPAVYITAEEASVLLDIIHGTSSTTAAGTTTTTTVSSSDPIVIAIYERWRPHYNISAVLIWALGVFVAWLSSYRSSLDIRNAQKKFVLYRELKSREVVNNNQQQQSRNSSARGSSYLSSATASSGLNESNGHNNDSGDERTIYSAADDADNNNNLVQGNDNNDDDAAAIVAHTYSTPKSEESMELTPAHAVGFLFSASTSLLILFYFKIYAIVKIMYALGCSGAFAQTLVHPGLTYICQRLRYTKPMQNYTWLTEENVAREVQQGSKMKSHCLSCLLSFFGPVSPIDVVAILLSYGVGATWLYIGFTVPHPGTVTFYWLIQDIFGLCMCMLFLETIKLNAIKVGAILLIVAFFYDIFFVFVTPLLTKHGESIMVNVATSGGPPKADPSWCEKYPHDVDCKGGDPLPMLFSVPRIGDYQGGSSMLGLGDIVLPGLLLSFASRYDESKRLMGMISGGSGRVVINSACQASPRCFLCSWCTCCIGTGYFGPVMVAYAIGLAMANIAVYVMEMGQPALLYLVPCCLGTMVYMGKKAGELTDLWDGPRAIRFCETLLYGAASQEVENADAERDREEDRSIEPMSVNNEEAELT